MSPVHQSPGPGSRRGQDCFGNVPGVPPVEPELDPVQTSPLQEVVDGPGGGPSPVHQSVYDRYTSTRGTRGRGVSFDSGVGPRRTESTGLETAGETGTGEHGLRTRTFHWVPGRQRVTGGQDSYETRGGRPLEDESGVLGRVYVLGE